MQLRGKLHHDIVLSGLFFRPIVHSIFFGYDDIPPKNDPKMTKVANETRKSLFTKTIAQFHYLVKIVHKSTYIVYPLSTPYV